MCTVHSRRAAFTLAVSGALLGTGLAAPAFAATTSVSGIVFQDLNDNGTRDAGEAVRADVEVKLQGRDGTSTTRTGPDGRYTFSDVVAGTYQLGVSNTFDLRAVPVTVDATGATRDLPGYAGWITGVVFDDVNRDGTMGPDEDALPGVWVTVTEAGAPVATLPTSEQGEYQVMVGRAGTYTVEVKAPDGTIVTTPSPVTVTVTKGEAAPRDVGLGQRRNVDVELFTYRDLDGDGTVDTPADRGAPIRYTIRPTGGGTPVEGTTGDDGRATLNLLEGTYEVTLTPPAGQVATRQEPTPLNVVADGSPQGASLGVTEPAEYRGIVYIDSNNDRERNADEPLVEGATVELAGPRATYKVTTDDKGAYHVPGILPDTYRVTVTLPDRYTDTVNSLTHSSEAVFTAGKKVTADYFVTGRTAATEPGQMKGRIFIDANENRTFDAGETPLTGTTITLTGADGKVYSTTVEASGAYSLTGLPPGVYRVTVIVADAFKDRVSNPTYTSTVTITSGEATEADYFITRAVAGAGGTTTGGGLSTTPATTGQARSAPAATTSGRASSGRQLARTGAETGASAGAAVGLIGLGAALIAWRRRLI